MSIKTCLKGTFGDRITKIKVQKQWLKVEIEKPLNEKYNDEVYQMIKKYCEFNWDYPNNIIVEWR